MIKPKKGRADPSYRVTSNSKVAGQGATVCVSATNKSDKVLVGENFPGYTDRAG